MVPLLSTWTAPEDASHVDAAHARRVVRESLAAVRAHLGMEVAFVGRFARGRRWFEYVDADAAFCPIEVGGSDDLEASFCARVVDGRLPQLIRDARRVPVAADLPATRELPVGAHLSVPLLRDGDAPFGTLCCFSRAADPQLRERDLEVLRLVADVVAGHLSFLVEHEETATRALSLVTGVLAAGGPAIALQPIVDLRSDVVCGFEALARFPQGAGWAPDRWFAEAERLGMGAELEGAAVRAALALLPELPDGTSLSVNLSPRALCSDDRIVERLVTTSPTRLVVELTEHDRVAYSALLEQRLERLRDAGVRIAVDDAGSGYAGLEHILQLRPDVLKLDRVLVQDVAEHPGRQALCEAMVRFTERTGASLVAEGVECEADLAELRRIGVGLAQGFLLGRPTLWT